MPDDPVIEVRGLTKSAGPVRILNGIDLEVGRGEVFGLLGPTGAGKTTLLHCLLDLVRPDGGRLRVLGLDPRRQGVALRRQVGYLPSGLWLEEDLTVEATLRRWAGLRGGPVDWAWCRHLVARLELDLRPRIRTLSRGQRQKVGLVLALLHRPALLLLDEPIAGLDPLTQGALLDLIREVRAETGLTVVIATAHQLSAVEAIADRVALMEQGTVAAVLAPAALAERALRQVRVVFARPVPRTVFTEVPGVRVLVEGEGLRWLLEVTSELAPLVRTLARFPVCDLEVVRPSLAEVFRRGTVVV